MNEKFIVLDAKGRVIDSFDSFEDAFKHVTFSLCDGKGVDVFIPVEDLLNNGVLCITIMKVRKRPFKILREVKITIHDEIKRKEVERDGSTEDHSCDNLFEEW